MKYHLHVGTSICFCVMVCTHSILRAQTGTIEGRVFNNLREPIRDLHVTIENYPYADVTDTDGRFIIERIPPGTYTIQFDHIAYQTKQIENIRVSQNQHVNLQPIILEDRVIRLTKLVVTATRTDRKITECPQSVNTISEARIQQRQAKTSAESLREECGISVQKTSHGGGSAILRGLSSNQILILVDGIRLNNATYRLGNHQYLTTVDPFMLDRIEVVRGPTSVLYGTDALGGTIHLITKSPPFPTSDTSIQYHLLGRYATADKEKTTRADLRLVNPKWIVMTGVGLKDYDDLRRGKNSDHPELENATKGTVQSPSGFKAWDGDLKMIHRLASNQNLTLAYQHSEKLKVPRYDKYENNDYFKWVYHPQIRNLTYLVYENKNPNKICQSIKSILSYHQQIEGREIQKSETSERTQEKDRVNTIGISFHFQSAIKNHNLAYGLETYFDKISSHRYTVHSTTGEVNKENRGRYPDNATYNQTGFYLQDEMTWHPKWTLLAGIRYSFFQTTFDTPEDTLLGRIDQQFQAFTGSLGFIYTMMNNTTMNINIAQGFRAPNLSDLSKFGESKGNIYEVPNADLVPEKILSVEANLKMETEKVKASLVVYQSQITDILDSAPFTYLGSSTIQIEEQVFEIKTKKNIGNALIRGLEASCFWRFYQTLSLDFQLTTTYGQNTTKNEPVGGIPPAFGMIGLLWKQERFEIHLFSRFASKQNRLSWDDLDDPRIPEGGTPGWHTLNVRFNWRIHTKYHLRLAVENIEDVNYREHGSGINSPGRNIIISIDMKK